MSVKPLKYVDQIRRNISSSIREMVNKKDQLGFTISMAKTSVQTPNCSNRRVTAELMGILLQFNFEISQ